jgi:uncharacterized protein
MRNAMLLTFTAAIGLAAWSATPATAFNCRIPALANASKKTVCASSLLRAADAKEEAGYASLRAALNPDARRALDADRRQFVATRDGCIGEDLCLEASYRAQLRLYTRLARCKAPGAKQTLCITNTTSAHREELHRSL